jgi:Transposase.
MAQCRASARTRGKSDPIDALAIARAAVREPDRATAHLDDLAVDVRLLSDRRGHLVATRTATVNQRRDDLAVDVRLLSDRRDHLVATRTATVNQRRSTSCAGTCTISPPTWTPPAG